LYFRTYFGEEEDIGEVDSTQPHMLDEVFGSFDDLSEILQNEIMYHYNKGEIEKAYEIFIEGTTGE
jgi:hypothetical protein